MLLNSSYNINHFYFSEEDIDDENENDGTGTMKKVNCHPLCSSFVTCSDSLFSLKSLSIDCH